MKKYKLIPKSFLLIILFLVPMIKVYAIETKTSPKADFRLDYILSGKTYIVNDSVLPEYIGNKFPYKLYCTNLSEGSVEYEWFIKYPGQDYISLDKTENPVLPIKQWGKVYIKLRINNNDSYTREYYVSTLDFGIKKENNIISTKEFNKQKGVFSTITTIVESSAVFSNEPFAGELTGDIKVNSDSIVNSDFKISYYEDNKFYNVNNGPIPVPVKTLPYKVVLTNTGEDNSFVWYIKLPGYDYVWMDNVQNAEAGIWHYGTTWFKLVVDGDFSNAVEYCITAFGPGEINELNEALKRQIDSMDIKHGEADFTLKCVNPVNGIMYDVTNKSIRNDKFPFPLKILPVNLSKGELSYEWLIRKPGSDSYQPVSSLPIIIYEYGSTYIKLKINNNESITSEKKVVSYFLLD